MEQRKKDVLVEAWPALPLVTPWLETRETLHLWMQVVGKVRLELSPYINHWWQVPLYLTARGLTTSSIPVPGQPGQIFEVLFDFIDHQLLIQTSAGTGKTLPLIPRSVSEFYHEFMESLHALGIEVRINPLPSEIQHPIPCDQDDIHDSYDAESAQRFWRVLLHIQAVMKEFRGGFIGKASPIHFFWGSFDLAVTRFSGRRAPARPGADLMTREAYSHEVSSCGFWPGDSASPEPVFYAYSAPEPVGFREAAVRPDAAFYYPALGEFVLRYEDVHSSANPEQTLLEFFQSTYEAGATLGRWDRAALERTETV
ncbi:DUF5996 family protein [Dictyobacter kobayashii]|uniref:Ava_C0101 and related proteins n=1 Tax=Dictyobacter kobayashii TaxID=2014872 RepID=A0A402APG9_9CHLR|nr:DUF5996 family protein [Dictyobacter kobayashii]GCE20870.1 hypothetical protein KDK_46700 [Dictyobacter kobayashii]